MKMFLKKAWSWIRHYWYVPFILVATIALYVVKKKDVIDWVRVLDNARNSHRDEIDAIEETHAQEIARREKINKQAEYAERQIRDQFERDSKELDRKTERRVKSIIKSLKDDPEKMARELRVETGYDVIIVP